MKTALAIMSRVPVAGQTKTRLMEKISPEECAVFHRACLADILQAAAGTNLAGYLYWADDEHRPLSDINAKYIDAHLANLFSFRRQAGRDLGERMAQIVKEILMEYDAVIIIGCDIPEIDRGLLLEAAGLLQSADVVLGPAVDGGYYLIGFKRFQPNIFQSISWSTDRVLAETVERISHNKDTYRLLETKHDIDTWADLLAFVQRGFFLTSHAKLQSFKYAQRLVQKYVGNEERE